MNDKKFALDLSDFMSMLREAVNDTGEVTLTEETLDELDRHISAEKQKQYYAGAARDDRW